MLYGKLPVSIDQCKEKLTEALRERGVHEPRAGAMIVDTFLRTEEHVSSEDLKALLEKEGIALEQDIVGQALRLLSDYGFAIEMQFEGENTKRYEHLHPQQHHDHFICMKCKKVVEFSDEKLEDIQNSLIFRKGCKPLFHKLEVYGICDECGYAEKRSIPITYAKEGSHVRVHKVDGPPGIKKRLIELGFIENEQVHIVKNSHFGPLILEVKGSRFAVGRGQAQRILVFE